MFAYLVEEDLWRWNEQGRHDILAVVAGLVWAGDRIIARDDGRCLSGCPFLGWEGTHSACLIYDTRPRVCREFEPASSALCPQGLMDL